MIHAGIDSTLNLNLAGHQLHEIAADGLATGGIVARDVVELHPGYRSDVLVKASDRPGKYLPKTEATDAANAIRGRTVPATYVAVVIVVGAPKPMTLPQSSALADYRAHEPIDEREITAPVRKLTLFSADGRFQIDGRPFDPTRIDQSIRLGAVEEWEIMS